jgi:hypothetical protein
MASRMPPSRARSPRSPRMPSSPSRRQTIRRSAGQRTSSSARNRSARPQPGRGGLRLEPAAGVPVGVTCATEVALWELAGGWHGLDGEIARLDELQDALIRKLAPDLLALPGMALRPQRRCWRPPATTPIGSPAKLRSRTCAGPRRYRPPPARPPGTASTPAATATPTRHCGASCWSG